MAVPKLDLERAGLLEDSQLTRYERTHKWLQSCTDPIDSLEETDSLLSAHSEVATCLDSSQIRSRAAGRAISGRSPAQTLDYKDTDLEQILSQVLGKLECFDHSQPSAHAYWQFCNHTP